MKKNILILSLSVFCFACGGSSSDSNTGGKASITDNPDFEKGLNLIVKSDCLGCHKTNEVSVGPAYNLIGKKYENTEANINMLAEKVKIRDALRLRLLHRDGRRRHGGFKAQAKEHHFAIRVLAC